MDQSYLRRLPSGSYGQQEASAGGGQGSSALGWQGVYQSRGSSYGGGYGSGHLQQAGQGGPGPLQGHSQSPLYGQQGLSGGSQFSGLSGSMPGRMQQPGSYATPTGGDMQMQYQGSTHGSHALSSSPGFQAAGSGFHAYQSPPKQQQQQQQQPQGLPDMANLPPFVVERLQSLPSNLRAEYLSKIRDAIQQRQAQAKTPSGFQPVQQSSSQARQLPRESWDGGAQSTVSISAFQRPQPQGPASDPAGFGSQAPGGLTWQQPQQQSQAAWGGMQAAQQQYAAPGPASPAPAPKPKPVDICSEEVAEARKKQLKQALDTVLSKATAEASVLTARGGQAVSEAAAPEPVVIQKRAAGAAGGATGSSGAKIEGMKWFTKEGELGSFDPDDPKLLAPPPPIDPAAARWKKRSHCSAFRPTDCTSEPTLRIRPVKEAVRIIEQGWSGCSEEEKAAEKAVLRRVFGDAIQL